MDSIVEIIKVQDFQIEALWSDGKRRTHDFEAYLEKWKSHPQLSKLAEVSIFTSVGLEYGTLVWKQVSLLPKDGYGIDYEDNYLSLSTDMLFRDGVIIEEYKPQHKLASVIKKLRTAYNMTQEQLAVKVGVSKTYISKIERGVTDINYGTYEWILELGFNKTLVVADLVERDNWVPVKEKQK